MAKFQHDFPILILVRIHFNYAISHLECACVERMGETKMFMIMIIFIFGACPICTFYRFTGNCTFTLINQTSSHFFGHQLFIFETYRIHWAMNELQKNEKYSFTCIHSHQNSWCSTKSVSLHVSVSVLRLYVCRQFYWVGKSTHKKTKWLLFIDIIFQFIDFVRLYQHNTI